MPTAFLTSSRQDYATPWPLIEAIEDFLCRKFTLDVCASEKSAKAPLFFTKEENGLAQGWGEQANSTDLVWCNPEYGDGKIPNWLYKADREKEDNRLTTVFLLPANKTDQGFWHDLVIPNHEIWYVKGRVDFLDPDTGEVPVIWKPNKNIVWEDDLVLETKGNPLYGKWVKQSNPQASVIVIVGPGFGPCAPKSFVWK